MEPFCGVGASMGNLGAKNVSDNKYQLFKAYMGIDDMRTELKNASFKRKAKIAFFMGAFNFILLYKFFKNQPLINEE